MKSKWLFFAMLMTTSACFSRELGVNYGLAFMTEGDVIGDSLGWYVNTRSPDAHLGWGFSQNLTVGNNRGALSLLFADERYDELSFNFNSKDSLMFAGYGIYRPFLNFNFDLQTGISFSRNKSESWTLIIEDPTTGLVVGGPNSTTHANVLGVYTALKMGLIERKAFSIDLYATARGVRVAGPEGYSIGLTLSVE